MEKDFDTWNILKKKVNKLNSKTHHKKQIWWSIWGLNIGFEEDGKGEFFERPVLVIKVLSRNTCIVLPLTSSEDKNSNRVDIGLINGIKSKVILSQIKVIDTRRLTDKVCVLDVDVFTKVKEAVKNMF
ncbi:type II toxin-antitoxin system PemK/MazF family toxin [Candidatus Parcubacteria bacterium]|nr:type II toxin-antitoxin system PemK/MazF family toxin [Candidatus Parcubacteria bacterium]